MRRATGLLVVLLVAGAARPQAYRQQETANPVIVTTGTASVTRAPDQAWVTIAAEGRGGTSADAQRLAAEGMTAVNAALAGAGIQAEAIRTTGFSLRPDMEYVNGRGRVRGYIASNQIEVRVDDLVKLGAVLDAAGASGATSMSGLRFDVKDRASFERQALSMAVKDAMSRAQAMASGAGARLGPIVRIDEQSPGPPIDLPMRMSVTESRAPETPISPGEIEIRVQVMLTVSIR
jgi:uncharacterized protein YggE